MKFSKIIFNQIELGNPDFRKPVLIKYFKGKELVITQGYLADRQAELQAGHPKLTWDWYGLTWFDYADRQIQDLKAKKSKNKVIAWCYLD